MNTKDERLQFRIALDTVTKCALSTRRRIELLYEVAKLIVFNIFSLELI